MAVAARPGATDARVPCPLCGGLIHPIAGKCKHCKADLASYHSARPAADAPLPALPPLHPVPAGNGHAGAPSSRPPQAGHAAAVAVAASHEAQPVLPPRPTTRGHTAEPGPAAWRSWPVVVIVLAMAAIIAAVVLMMWPADKARSGGAGKHSLQPPPAPERMPIDLDIKPPRPDRRNQALPHAGATPDPWTHPADPTPQNPGARPADPGDPDDADRDPDPQAVPRAPSTTLGGRLPLAQGTITLAMVAHVCRKMLQCRVDNPAMTNLCARLARTPVVPPANCPAAYRCLQLIDAMSCGSQIADLSQLGEVMTQFTDCAEAASC